MIEPNPEDPSPPDLNAAPAERAVPAADAPEPVGTAPAVDRYAVLRIRDFRLYLGARFIAAMGQQMLGTAVGWELYRRTHSTLALGLVGLMQIVPLVLLTLPAGHVAEQRERRSIILWTEGLLALGSLGLTAVSWWQGPVVLTYVALFLSGIARTFLWPASGAFLPQIVPRPLYPAAVTWNSGSYQISAALGPAVGGLVIAVTGGAAAVYAFNVAAGLACCVLTAMVRARPEMTAKKEKMTVAALLAGLRFVVNTRIVLGTISLDLFAVLLGGAVAMLPVYASDILHVGPDRLGWLRAALPVGSASMAFFIAHRPPMQHAGRSMLLAVAGFGVATVVFGLSRSFWLSLGMMFACGALDSISVVVRHTLVQVLTPDDMRGRVSAINSLFIGTSNEFGDFESGFVASLTSPVFAVVSGGIGTVLVVVATALIWPDIRRYGRLDGEKPAAG